MGTWAPITLGFQAWKASSMHTSSTPRTHTRSRCRHALKARSASPPHHILTTGLCSAAWHAGTSSLAMAALADSLRKTLLEQSGEGKSDCRFLFGTTYTNTFNKPPVDVSWCAKCATRCSWPHATVCIRMHTRRPEELPWIHSESTTVQQRYRTLVYTSRAGCRCCTPWVAVDRVTVPAVLQDVVAPPSERGAGGTAGPGLAHDI